MLRWRSLRRAVGVMAMACLFLCAQANVATAVRGGDGEENS